MNSMEWKTYRTRFLVKAKKLNYSLTFTDPLGRQHCGRKGDYLVETSDGVISIAPRQIFEDIYVPMSAPEELVAEEFFAESSLSPLRPRKANEKRVRCEPLGMERIVATNISQPVVASRILNQEAVRSRRKLPQTVRSQRLPSQLGLM